MYLIIFCLVLTCAFCLWRWIAEARHNNSLHAKVRELEERLNSAQRLSDGEDDDPEMEVGNPVSILIGGFLVRGNVLSVAAPRMSYANDLKPGFLFKAYNDSHTLWLSHDDPTLLLEEEKIVPAMTPQVNPAVERWNVWSDTTSSADISAALREFGTEVIRATPSGVLVLTVRGEEDALLGRLRARFPVGSIRMEDLSAKFECAEDG